MQFLWVSLTDFKQPSQLGEAKLQEAFWDVFLSVQILSWYQQQAFKTRCYLAVWGTYLQYAWIDNYIFPCSKNKFQMGVAASSAEGAEATEQSPWAVPKSVQQPHSSRAVRDPRCCCGEGREESPFSARFSPPEIGLKQPQVLLSQGINWVLA